MWTIILHWLLIAMVLTVNALANILPINGYNTGQISGFYPNYFVPAGFTFGIWSVIYLLLIAYTIAYTYYYPKREKFSGVYEYLHSIYPLYWATCFLNAGWILAWHYLQMFLSVALMICFLITLMIVFSRSMRYAPSMKRSQRFTLVVPFVVYFGWITVATIANITAMLVYLKWDGGGISGIHWSIVLIIIAVLLAMYIGYRYRTAGYSLVIAWALWGIYKGQGPNDPALANTSLVGCILAAGMAAFAYLGSIMRFSKASAS